MTMMSLLKMATMLTITPVKKFATGQEKKQGGAIMKGTSTGGPAVSLNYQ